MKKIINEQFKRMQLLAGLIVENEGQHLGSYGHNPHQISPKDMEDYLKEIDGMSTYEAIEYLGLQGLSSSQAKEVLSKLDTSIEDEFNEYSDYESINNPSTNTIDRLSNDDLYESVVNEALKKYRNKK